MKGTWTIPYYEAAGAGEDVPAPISTGVPIGTGGFVFVAVLKKGENLPGESGGERAEKELVCPGSANEPLPPTEAFGEVPLACVYILSTTNLKSPVAANEDMATSGAGFTATFEAVAAGVAKAHGSWSMRTP